MLNYKLKKKVELGKLSKFKWCTISSLDQMPCTIQLQTGQFHWNNIQEQSNQNIQNILAFS